MRLANLTEFRRTYFSPASAPAISTLRARIAAGKIPGGMVDGGRYYVDLDEYERAKGISVRNAQRRTELMRHPLLRGLV